MRITCDPAKREWTLQERGLDMRRAKEVFAGPHFTRADDRQDYGEPHSRLARFSAVRMDAARRRKTHHQYEALP